MNRSFYGLFLASIIALVSFGCAPGDSADTATDDTPAAPADGDTAEAHPEHATMLCGKCGHEAGSDSCCAEGAETCDCGMHKGSKLCCVELGEDAAGKNVCTGCGVAVGADEHHHCDATADKCEKCGLNAGSAGCCKISS